MIHEHHSGLNASRHAFAPFDVSSKHGTAQPVFRIIGQSNGLILVSNPKEQGNRAKKFFDISGGSLLDVGEDGRLHKGAGTIDSASAQQESRSGCDRALYLVEKIKQR